jgi:hypothetical protein
MLRGYERQGINSWLKKFRIFGECKSHIVKEYADAGGRRIKEIVICFAVKTQSCPSTRISIGVVRLQTGTLRSSTRSLQAIVGGNGVEERWKKFEMSSNNELAKGLTGEMRILSGVQLRIWGRPEDG